MSFKNKALKILTPKDTEEIKPNLYIQKTLHGYRQIHPAAWNGKISVKNLLVGSNFWKNLFIFLLIMVIAFSYNMDTKSCREFQENPCKNIINLTSYCYSSGVDMMGGDTIKDGEEDYYYAQVSP